MGRKPIPINEDQVWDLARRGWSAKQISIHFCVSYETILNRFSQLIEDARQEGNASISDLIWDRARAGDTKMIERLDDRRNGPIVRKIEISTEEAIQKLKDDIEREEKLIGQTGSPVSPSSEIESQ